jgi:hypothetical protein
MGGRRPIEWVGPLGRGGEEKELTVSDNG